MKSRNNRLRGNLCLLLAAMIWGCAFAFQSMAAERIGPWLFNGARFTLGGLEVLALSPFLEKIAKDEGRKDIPSLIKAGVIAGLILLCASVLQQAGIRYTTAGKAGFITSLYVVLVPLAGWLILKQKIRASVMVSAVIALAALWLLAGPQGGAVQPGDLMELACAAAFTVHILVVDRVVGSLSAIRFCYVQFLTAGLFGLLGAFLFETVDWAMLGEAAVPILYAGLASAGMGYTLQILGQRDADPAVASVLLSLESVFSVIFGYLLLGEVMSVRELLGCALMFAAVLLSQR